MSTEKQKTGPSSEVSLDLLVGFAKAGLSGYLVNGPAILTLEDAENIWDAAKLMVSTRPEEIREY